MSRVLFLFCRVFFYVCLKIVKWLTEYISGFAADFSSVYANMISVEVERARTILGAPGPWAVAVAWSVDSWLSVPSCDCLLAPSYAYYHDRVITSRRSHPSIHPPTTTHTRHSAAGTSTLLFGPSLFVLVVRGYMSRTHHIIVPSVAIAS